MLFLRVGKQREDLKLFTILHSAFKLLMLNFSKFERLIYIEEELNLLLLILNPGVVEYYFKMCYIHLCCGTLVLMMQRCVAFVQLCEAVLPCLSKTPDWSNKELNR